MKDRKQILFSCLFNAKHLQKLIVIAFYSIALLLFSNHSLPAQEWHPGDPLKIKLGKGDSAFSIQPFAVVRVLMTYADKQLYTSDPGTRGGFRFEQQLGSQLSVFGHVELSMRLMNTGQKFALSPDNSTESGSFSNAEITSSNNVFGLRQTFIGFNLKKYGSISFGKQNSAYKMVGERTDISEANSGFASYVYSTEGSDGGLTGTGRANNNVTYKNTFGKRLQFAVSGMFSQNAKSDSSIRTMDAASVSAILTVTKGFDLAVAYNHVFIADAYFKNEIVYGLKNNPNYLLLGAQYKNKHILLAVNYAFQKYGDLTNVKTINSSGNVIYKTVVYSGSGFEGVGQYNYKKWIALGGVNLKSPARDENKLMSGAFNRQHFFYGIQYRTTKSLTIFFEGRIEDSKDANGIQLPDANMIGLKFII